MSAILSEVSVMFAKQGWFVAFVFGIFFSSMGLAYDVKPVKMQPSQLKSLMADYPIQGLHMQDDGVLVVVGQRFVWKWNLKNPVLLKRIRIVKDTEPAIEYVVHWKPLFFVANDKALFQIDLVHNKVVKHSHPKTGKTISIHKSDGQLLWLHTAGHLTIGVGETKTKPMTGALKHIFVENRKLMDEGKYEYLFYDGKNKKHIIQKNDQKVLLDNQFLVRHQFGADIKKIVPFGAGYILQYDHLIKFVDSKEFKEKHEIKVRSPGRIVGADFNKFAHIYLLDNSEIYLYDLGNEQRMRFKSNIQTSSIVSAQIVQTQSFLAIEAAGALYAYSF